MGFDFAYYLALWRMRKLPPERVPEIATVALVNGLDSPALRQLAGLSKPVSAEIEPLIERAAAELGVISAIEAEVESRLCDQWIQNAIPVARHIATEMLSGTLEVVEGWLSLPYRDGDVGPLEVFFQHEVPDSSVAFDEDFRARMLAAAQLFMNSMP